MKLKIIINIDENIIKIINIFLDKSWGVWGVILAFLF